jgi:hypothetical protein
MTYAAYIDDDEVIDEHRASIRRLTQDMAAAAATMGPREARFLVDTYYTFQENRKRAGNQARALAKGVVVPESDLDPSLDADFEPDFEPGLEPELNPAEERPTPTSEPHVLIDWIFEQSRVLEGQIKRSLDKYTQGQVMGDWMRQVTGIGPVISAGIIANLEQPRPTAGRIYAFAGIAGKDQKPWLAGQKRPFNRRLKVVFWHAGQSFMKLHNRPDCFYGKLYERRKLFEQRMSDSGQRTQVATEWKAKLDKLQKTKSEAYQHYSAGRLPPGHIDARARRWAVKIFISHMNEVWLVKLGRPVPAPFALARMAHADYIPPPIPA